MADEKKVIKRLSENKISDKNGDPKPCFQHMHQPQSLTNARIRAGLIGLCNYYKLANNRIRFTSRIAYIMRHSVAKMYAAKYKLKNRAQIFKRAGRGLDRPLIARQGDKALGVEDKERAKLMR